MVFFISKLAMHQGYMPGYVDSHGCIRLPVNMAQVLYAKASVGTPVKITESCFRLQRLLRCYP